MSCQAPCDCEFRYDNGWEYDCAKPRRTRSGRGYKTQAKDIVSEHSDR